MNAETIIAAIFSFEFLLFLLFLAWKHDIFKRQRKVSNLEILRGIEDIKEFLYDHEFKLKKRGRRL